MKMTTEECLAAQRAFFESGATKDYSFRIDALTRLEKAIHQHEDEINQALRADLNKSPFETYMCETGMVLSEISYAKKHLKRWMRKKYVRTPLAQFPSKSFTLSEPYGVVLILAPWNYPLMLALDVLAGAIAAGNCAVISPSEYAPVTAHVMRSILGEIFPENYVAVASGCIESNQELLSQRFDYIFFTGSPHVGRIVMQAAAAHMTPVTLELGGKSPCIVDETANLKIAARRLAFGKCLNAGQTCVAPDYLLIHESVRDDFLSLLKMEIISMYGEAPLLIRSFPRIISKKHFDRILRLIEDTCVSSDTPDGLRGSGTQEGRGSSNTPDGLRGSGTQEGRGSSNTPDGLRGSGTQDGRGSSASLHSRPASIYWGGKGDDVSLKIEPTILTDVTPNSAVMSEELFAPVLPVLAYRSLDEAVSLIKQYEKPLALYLFTSSRASEEKILSEISFGGGCINDTIIHLATPHMGFGGVGNSGIGAYHGKKSFETFSHEKSILKKSTLIDLPIRYQPETPLKNRLLRMFLK